MRREEELQDQKCAAEMRHDDGGAEEEGTGLCKLQGYCNLDKLLKLLWAVTFVSSVTQVTFLLNRIAINCIKVKLKLKCCNFCNFCY